MKPSERINEIYKTIKKEDFETASFWQKNFCKYNKEFTLLEAIIKYLDEQHEKRGE